jgi:hypothetical protein
MDTGRDIRSFNQVYINGYFAVPHGTQIIDLINPSDNEVIGKVTLADEIDARNARRCEGRTQDIFADHQRRADGLPAASARMRVQADGRPRCRDGVGIRRAAGTRQGLQRACGQHLPAFRNAPPAHSGRQCTIGAGKCR